MTLFYLGLTSGSLVYFNFFFFFFHFEQLPYKDLYVLVSYSPFFNVHARNIYYCQRVLCAWNRTRIFLLNVVFNSANYQMISAVYVELYFIG